MARTKSKIGAFLVGCVLAAPYAYAQFTSTTARRFSTVTFAQLGAPLNGSVYYCSNCAVTAPCTGSGSGAFAYRVGSAWNCTNGAPSSGGTWGSITGTLSSQTDLQSALDLKAPLSIPENSKSAAYTTVLSDAGGMIYHPSADTTARTWTIDSNANVAYPIGTTLTFVNDCSAGTLTIAITSDTMILAGTGTTGSRTLAACGMATALKITSTRWIINGAGLS